MPPGYHPLDVEKEWGKLHVAILEREKLLRSEFERWVAPGPEAAVGGWGPAVAGKPPEDESLLGRKSPPHGRDTHTGRAGRTVGCRPAGRLGTWALLCHRSRWAAPSRRSLVLGLRLECLQRIVSKLQMEAGLCEEQLNQADALLQSVRGAGLDWARRGGVGEVGGAHTCPASGPPAPPSWPVANSDC